MDVCLLELAQTDDQPAQAAEPLLAACWVVVWSTSEENQETAHELCAALPLVTTEEAQLN